MKKNEVFDIIRNELEPLLKKKNFRYLKKNNVFKRKFKGGNNVLNIALTDYRPVYYVQFNILTRLDDVEEIFHKFSGIPEKYQKDSYTLNLRQTYFSSNINERFEINSEVELNDCIRNLIEETREKFHSFLIDCNNQTFIEDLINSKYEEFGQPYRAMHGLILSKMENSDFEKIKKMYATNLPILSPLEKVQYSKLIKYLT